MLAHRPARAVVSERIADGVGQRVAGMGGMA
jgi:hypothetical protein